MKRNSTGYVNRVVVRLALAGLVVGVVGCSGGDPASRTKNGVVVTTTTAAAPTSDISLANTAGLIGYPLKLVASSPSSPNSDFAFSTSTAGCRVDKYLNFLYYDVNTQGTCAVAVTKTPAAPLVPGTSPASTTTTTTPARADATISVTFYPQTVPTSLANGLVGYWPFNSASTLGWNAVTNKVDLAAKGSPSFRQVGKFGGAATFNGSTDYFAGTGTSGGIAGLPTKNNPYTISMWMLPNKFDGGRGLMGWGTFGSDGNSKTNAFRLKGDYDNVLGYVPGGLVNYWWGNDLTWDGYTFTEAYKTPAGQDVCCRSAFTKTQWVHVAVTYDGKSRRIYYNGVEKASDNAGDGLAVANTNFRIGATTLKEFFGGSLDDAAVWSRALSPNEIVGLSRASLGGNNAALPTNFAPFSPNPCYVQGGFCEVGDVAPDGSTVFYVGDFVDQLTKQPMKYLSFAPDDLRTQISGLGNAWMKGYETLCGSDHPIPEADKTGIGWGRRNTVIISNFCSTGAADKVLELTSGGVGDWFIPSERELNELCKYARGQRVGDTAVNCDGKGSLPGGWAMDSGHGFFVSSTQGAVVNATLGALASVVGPLNEWLTAAVVIAQKTKVLDQVKWGNLQQWRVGYDFNKGTKVNELSDYSLQVRPVRAFGPGFQKPLVLAASNGTVGAPLQLSTIGGSGEGRVSYVVTEAGSARCTAAADGSSVTPTSVGACKVTAVKAASEQYFRNVAAEQLISVSQGRQAVLSIAPITAEVGTAFRPVVSGGSGDGAVSLTIKEPGTAACAFATGSISDVVATSAGTCTVSAVKAADANYLAGDAVTATITVNKRRQADLVVATTSGGIDTEVALSTTGGSGSGAISYAVADAGPTGCSIVAGRNAIVAGSVGQCKITATRSADSMFDAKTSAASTITFSNPTCDDSGRRPDGSACQVGDTGPGGGRVFYVSPTPIDYADGISSGGTFLEVAPAGWNGTSGEPLVGWCRANVGRGFGSGIGAGANNTFAQMQAGCVNGTAVALAAGASVNGKDDWFVPSLGEMNEVCKFMRRQVTGDGAVNCNNSGSLRAPFQVARIGGANYWTSTEVDTRNGLAIQSMNLDNGTASTVMQTSGSQYVRPIRAFGSQKPPTTTSTSSTTTTTVPSQACSSLGKHADGTPCRVGDIGPAGGVVFYAGSTPINAVAGISNGGRYLEAAPLAWTPYSARSSEIPLGACVDRLAGATAAAIGNGAANTTKLKDCGGGASNLGQFVVDLTTTNGGSNFDDWFIPSRDEAMLMAPFRVQLDGLRKDQYIWSSTEVDEPITRIGNNWAVSMFDGATARAAKNWYAAVVRPVRAFG